MSDAYFASDRTTTYLALAIAAVFLTGLAVGYGALATPGSTPAAPAAAAPTAAAPQYLYLTVQINPVTGWPQYSPANFTVGTGTVIVTIYDYDAPSAWPACPCEVTGTASGGESVNGSLPMTTVPSQNVAHTFTVPALGLAVFSPGTSTVEFTVNLTAPGAYTWMCTAPCGTDGYTGGAMSLPGYMSGTMTVVGP